MKPSRVSFFLVFLIILGFIGCHSPKDCSPSRKPVKFDCGDLDSNIIPNQLIITFKSDTIKLNAIGKRRLQGELRYSYGLNLSEIKILDSCMCNKMILIEVDFTKVDPNESVAEARTRTRDEGDIATLGFNHYLETGPFSQEAIVNIPNPGQIDTMDIPGSLPPGSSMLVAYVDSGLDMLKREEIGSTNKFSQYIWVNHFEQPGDGEDSDNNCLSDDQIGFDFRNGSFSIMDSVGHGTHLQGIMIKNYPEDINLRLINAKFISRDEPANLFDAVCGMYYAISKGTNCMNLSWGCYGERPNALTEVVKEACQKDILIVASAGNENMDVRDCPHWPSSYSTSFCNVISVAAIDTFQCGEAVALAAYSNFGKDVDLAAPGTAISSDIPVGEIGVMSGTSMAAAYVTREASIIWAENPGFTPKKIKAALIDRLWPILDTSKPLKNNGWLAPSLIETYNCND